jgi:hypothetical protein
MSFFSHLLSVRYQMLKRYFLRLLAWRPSELFLIGPPKLLGKITCTGCKKSVLRFTKLAIQFDHLVVEK